MTSFLKRSLLYLLIPLSLLAIGASYYRFMVLSDYIVEYDGMCDPASESCFVGCVDDECTEIYYYALVRKDAASAYAQCGPNVLECEAASVCLPTDVMCEITYCSPESVIEGDTCENLDEATVPAESEEDTDLLEDVETQPI